MRQIAIPYRMADVRERQNLSLFSVFSTFAGCGGSSTGYRLAGGNILGINEFIPAAIETYLANYPNTKVFPQDIRKLTGSRICRTLRIKPGELDILDGSPPCASFSTSGKREKGWGKVKKYSDTSQRVDDLFFEFARLLKEIQPKVFVTENVKGLKIGVARSVLGRKTTSTLGIVKTYTILEELRNCGYILNWKVLNSADFGVPQTRERLFIVGVREDLGIKPSFPKRTVSKWISLEEALSGISKDDDERFPFNEELKTCQYQAKCREGQNVSEIHPKGSYFNWGRYDRKKPAPTLMQACAGKYHTHYDGDRYINLLEGRRIQGFPDDFKLTGTLSQKWERLGRSVPPLMMMALINHIYKEILSKCVE